MTHEEFCINFNNVHRSHGFSVHLVRLAPWEPLEMAFSAKEWNLENVKAPCTEMRNILSGVQTTWRSKLEALGEGALAGE